MPIFDAASLDRLTKSLADDPPAYTSPAPEHEGVGAWPYLAIAGANAADIGTTLWNKSHGAVEGNPVLPNNAAMYGLKGLVMAAQMAEVHHLAATGHPTAAKVLGALSAIAPSVGASLNLRPSLRGLSQD